MRIDSRAEIDRPSVDSTRAQVRGGLAPRLGIIREAPANLEKLAEEPLSRWAPNDLRQCALAAQLIAIERHHGAGPWTWERGKITRDPGPRECADHDPMEIDKGGARGLDGRW